MKFALVCGKKTEATKGAIGFCPGCGSELIAKCGEVKINHWAHKGKRTCDKWWENETDWHRSWKGKFPVDWQEVWHTADDGEKHVADVKTKQGWTIEFQHSPIKPEERRSRDAFYPNLVWVVDGMRRVNDIKQFQRALEESRAWNKEPLILQVIFPEECRLLKEWINSESLVLFDFQKIEETIATILWVLLPGISSSSAYLMRISQNSFVEYHHDEKFDRLFKEQILSFRDQIIKTEKLKKKMGRSRPSRSPIYGKKYNPRRRRRF